MSGWAHVLHAVYKPWGAGSTMYQLQHGSLFVTTFVFLMVREHASERQTGLRKCRSTHSGARLVLVALRASSSDGGSCVSDST